MRTALRPWVLIGAVAAAVAVSITGVPAPDAPPGLPAAQAAPTALPSPLPSGWLLYDSNRCPLPATTCATSDNWEVYARDPSGNVYQLTDDARYDAWWPKLSPDRTKIMFLRNDAGTKELDWAKSSLWVLPVNGATLPIKLVGSGAGQAAPSPFTWDFLAHPEWAPTQDRIAIIGRIVGATPQIYVIPFTNATNTVGTPYRVTHGANVSTPRPGLVIDPSWRPDGGSVLFSGCTLNAARTACLTTSSSLDIFLTSAAVPPTPVEFAYSLTTDKKLNFDAYFSPNGTQVAWLHEGHCNRWDIRHATPSGTGGLMTNVSTVIDDGAVNSKPAWTPDSSTIYFHRYSGIEQTIWSVPAAGGSTTQQGLGTNAAVRCSAGSPSLTAGPPGTPTGPSPLPAGSIVLASNRCIAAVPADCVAPGNWNIFSLASGSTTPVQLAPTSTYESFAPRLSPDRSQIVFLRAPIGQKGDSASYSLWVMDATAGATPVQLVPPSVFFRLDNASWSHDGTAIVFDASTAAQEAKGPGPNQNNQIYWVGYDKATKTLTSGAYQATWGPGGAGDRPGNNIQPSWNPDGGSILFVGCTPNAGRTACNASFSRGNVHLISAIGPVVDTPRTTTTDGTIWAHPVSSPNGSYIAAIHQLTCSSSALVRMSSTGGSQTTLASPANTLVGNPAWSANSATVYYDRLPANVGPSIWRITPNAPSSPGPNGTALTQITGLPCGSDFPNAGNF